MILANLPPEHRRPRRCHGSAFTLIELLVAIGVIAVLATFLFIGAGRVREMADRTTCVSNMRKLSVAAHMFITEKREFPSWQRWYYPSTSSNPSDRGFREYFTPTGYQTESNAMTVATSPLLARRYRPYSGAKHTYAMNMMLSSRETYGLSSPTKVEFPSQMMHFMYGLAGERNGHGQHFYTPFLYHLSGTGSLDATGYEGKDRFYDNGFSTIAYFDGSVSRISREDALRFLRATSREAEIFWRGHVRN